MRPGQLPKLFFLSLVLGMAALLGVHTLLLRAGGHDPWGNLLAESYLFNVLMAAAVFFLIYRSRRRFKDQLAYFFLLGSLLKFLFFFLFLYPLYQADGLVGRQEFLTFFVPYLFGLFLETFFLAKLLNTVD